MKRTRLLTLLLTLVMVVATSQIALAKAYEAKGGTYTFNGEQIIASPDTAEYDEVFGVLEPGDSVTMTLTYVNGDSETTEWYLENTVLETLEEIGEDMAGGYTYRLINDGPDGETTIFDSDKVGGGVAGGLEGLKQATNATEGEYESQNYFFIQELDPGEEGYTRLYVALDGESQINSYENRFAELEFSYAVEKVKGEDVIKHVKTRKVVDTGDRNRLILAAAMFIGSLALLIIALRMRRREGKDGEEA